MLKSRLCDHSDLYILVKATIKVPNTAATAAATNNGDKKVIFKNCALFTDCMREINNAQVGNVKYNDLVMSVFNLIEYNDNYSKTSGSLA